MHTLAFSKAWTELNSPRLRSRNTRLALPRPSARETKFFEKAINLKNLGYLLTLDGVIVPLGGIPLTKQGKIIDTIGCLGGMDSQDELVCKAGAGAI